MSFAPLKTFFNTKNFSALDIKNLQSNNSHHMIIEKCEDTDTFIITFKKSKSPNVYNSYFVKVSKERSM